MQPPRAVQLGIIFTYFVSIWKIIYMTSSIPLPLGAPSAAGTSAARAAPPALIASDLDGTLLAGDGSVSARTRRAVAGARAGGARFVVATGRPVRRLEPLAGLAVDAYICMNGALVLDAARQRPRVRGAIEPDLARRLIDGLERQGPVAVGAQQFENGDELLLAGPDFPHNGAYTSASIDEILARPTLMLFIWHPGPSANLAARARLLNDNLQVSYSSTAGYIEVSAPGITKGSALVELAAELGIDRSHSAAFGDMPNDLEMLRWAGTPVAMANAVPEVKALAAHHAASNDDDGVARLLERWYGLGDA